VSYNLLRKHFGFVSRLALLAGCAQSATTRAPRRHKTLKGAVIGALSGAAFGIAMGKRKADRILTGTAIGAEIGAVVGAKMGFRKRCSRGSSAPRSGA